MNANYKADDHTTKPGSVLVELDDVEQLATLVYGGIIAADGLNVQDDDPRLLSQAQAFARAVHQQRPAFRLSAQQIWDLTIVATKAHTGNL